MHPLLALVKKIGHFEFALSILKAMRAKVECKYGFQNRIGRSFKEGFKGVLAVGEAGGGKTQTLKRIFNGLQLNLPGKGGRSVGVWVPSGISTGVGLFELLTANHSAVIVIDELDANTKLHVNILKQVASGQICRMKHQETNPTPFSGILLGATNGIPFSAKNTSHLLAMLERFTVVYIESSKTDDYYVVEDYHSHDLTKAEWAQLIRALNSPCNYDLTPKEHAAAKMFFEKKAQENLDPSKALYRQANDVMDIFLFLKRFCQVEDLTQHKDILSVAALLVKQTVHVNAAKLLAMDPIERAVYDFVDNQEGDSATLTNILEFCSHYGVMLDPRSTRALLNKMVRARIINKYPGDVYSTCMQEQKPQQVSAMAEVLQEV
jgi:hypothetical protein